MRVEDAFELSRRDLYAFVLEYFLKNLSVTVSQAYMYGERTFLRSTI